MMSSGKGLGIAEQLYQNITNQKLGISADTTTAEQAAKAAEQQNDDAAATLASALTGVSADDIKSMTPKQQAEMAALATESTLASSLLSSGE